MTDGVVDLKRQHLVTGIKQDAMEKYLFAVINKTGHARKVIRKRKLNPTYSIPQSQIRLAEIIW